MPEWREVRLPEDLCAVAEQRYHTKFTNVEELLTFVLKDLTANPGTQADQQEKEMVEQRLRDLGYV